MELQRIGHDLVTEHVHIKYTFLTNLFFKGKMILCKLCLIGVDLVRSLTIFHNAAQMSVNGYYHNILSYIQTIGHCGCFTFKTTHNLLGWGIKQMKPLKKN